VNSALRLNSATTAFALNNSTTGNLTIGGAITGNAGVGVTQTVTATGVVGGGNIVLSGSVITDGLTGGKVALVLDLGNNTTATALNTGNTFSGGVTLNSGTVNSLIAGTYNGFGTGKVTINGGTITTNTSGTVILANNFDWNNSFRVDRSGSTPTVNWTGAITLGADVTINGPAAGSSYNHIFDGAIGQTGGVRALSFTHTGTSGRQFITLNGNNTFTGNFTISQGSLTIGGTGRLGSGDYSGNISIGSSDGALTYSSSSDQILRGNISLGSTLGLTKNTSTTSTLTLAGANTYSGVTTISAGKLRISNTTGSATGTGAVNLSGGTSATLSGTGFSTSLLTVTNGSRIAAGINTTGPNGNFGAAGTLSLGTTGGMTLTSANLDFDLASVTTVGGGVNDLILTGGALSLTGTEAFTFNLLGATLQTGSAYTLISGATSSSFASGDFSTWTTNFVNSSAYTASYGLSGNNLQVTFAPIPEPSTALLAALSLLALLRRKR
jgi:autotransporter-associated beta strand protein